MTFRQVLVGIVLHFGAQGGPNHTTTGTREDHARNTGDLFAQCTGATIDLEVSRILYCRELVLFWRHLCSGVM